MAVRIAKHIPYIYNHLKRMEYKILKECDDYYVLEVVSNKGFILIDNCIGSQVTVQYKKDEMIGFTFNISKDSVEFTKNCVFKDVLNGPY